MSADRPATWTIGVDVSMVRVLELQARIESKKACTAAMHAANSSRVHLGASLAYGEEQFAALEKELIEIAEELRGIAVEVRNRQDEEKRAQETAYPEWAKAHPEEAQDAPPGPGQPALDAEPAGGPEEGKNGA